MKNKKIKKGLIHRIRILVSMMLFIIGAGIFLYPAISNYFVSIKQEEIMQNYAEAMHNVKEEDLSAYFEEAKIYNDNLAGDPLHDPFVLGSGYVIPENYKEVLNVSGDGVMGVISIPKIAVELPIYHGTSEEVLEQGAGHIESTSLPIGGENRHSVISAHRGLPKALLFTRLDELQKGDYFFVKVLNQTLAYQVDQIITLSKQELNGFTCDISKDYVTLLTCTPYGVNSHRLLVRGERVPYNQDVKKEETKKQSIIWIWIKEYFYSICLGICFLFVVVIVLKNRKRKV